MLLYLYTKAEYMYKLYPFILYPIFCNDYTLYCTGKLNTVLVFVILLYTHVKNLTFSSQPRFQKYECANVTFKNANIFVNDPIGGIINAPFLNQEFDSSEGLRSGIRNSALVNRFFSHLSQNFPNAIERQRCSTNPRSFL